MNAQNFEDLTIEAEGASLAAAFLPARGAARANLVLHPATGVPQRFYQGFASWASERGVGVLIYDYRDAGGSLRGPVRGSRATYADWILRDQAAAERRLAELAPTGPLWVLGHSLGGLGLPFRDQDPRVERITTIGSGHTHFTDHPWRSLPKALAFWFGPGPLAAALFGYMPGRKLLLGADLPAGVYWQFRRWCVRRDFYQSDVGRSLPEPDYGLRDPRITMMVVETDEVVPPAAVRRYAAKFGARADYLEIEPSALDLDRLGHIDAFAARNAACWPLLLDPPGASTAR